MERSESGVELSPNGGVRTRGTGLVELSARVERRKPRRGFRRGRKPARRCHRCAKPRSGVVRPAGV